MTNIDRFIAEHACERLIKRFAVLNDENRYEEMVQMFTEDGSFARPSQPENLISGRQALLESFQSRPLRLSRHFISNVVVDIKSETTATALSYVLLFTSEADAKEASAPYLFGRFKDRFKCVNGEWLFAQRLGSIDLKIV